jgi:hypothetical protein
MPAAPLESTVESEVAIELIRSGDTGLASAPTARLT